MDWFSRLRVIQEISWQNEMFGNTRSERVELVLKAGYTLYNSGSADASTKKCCSIGRPFVPGPSKS